MTNPMTNPTSNSTSSGSAQVVDPMRNAYLDTLVALGTHVEFYDPDGNRQGLTIAEFGEPGGPGMGMPMGGAHGGQGGGDKERKGKRYLEEDDDIWGVDEHVVPPPVIGEVNRRA